ncbi:unnamed protein product [marine sediment metagenome]|uniref:Helix-turn-helix domain-containing protein n=1 Tax=marine sediment metagenome TaxID=412755 RepID=X1TQC9_9ZZZZ
MHDFDVKYTTMRKSRAGFDERLLTVNEIAALLRVKPGTIRKWVHLQAIPVIRLGRAVRFCPGELAAWLEKRSQKAKSWD